MTGTYSRHKTKGNGLLNNLEDRLTSNRMERRTARIAMRVGREGAQTRGMVMALGGVFGRNFFGRLKWLLLGR